MEKTPWAIFLDLDQTLVLSSALAMLRRQRKWPDVYASFHVTTLPPGTQDFLQRAAAFASLGVITSTPRPYAEKLLAYHRLSVPVLVAYHDTRLHKPDPAPLLKAVASVNMAPAHCFYVGDTPDDLIAAVRAKVIPIGLCWDESLVVPSTLLPTCAIYHDWSAVLTSIATLMRTQEEIA